MRSYPVGLKWETKGYQCEILSTEMRSDGEYHWFSHDVRWIPKYRGYSTPHVKKMSTKKLEKEFKRLGIGFEPKKEKHFSEDLFSISP